MPSYEPGPPQPPDPNVPYQLGPAPALQVIKKHPSAHQLYATKLVEEGSMNPEEIKTIQDNVTTTLEREFADSKAGSIVPFSVQLLHLCGIL